MGAEGIVRWVERCGGGEEWWGGDRGNNWNSNDYDGL